MQRLEEMLAVVLKTEKYWKERKKTISDKMKNRNNKLVAMKKAKATRYSIKKVEAEWFSLNREYNAVPETLVVVRHRRDGLRGVIGLITELETATAEKAEELNSFDIVLKSYEIARICDTLYSRGADLSKNDRKCFSELACKYAKTVTEDFIKYYYKKKVYFKMLKKMYPDEIGDDLFAKKIEPAWKDCFDIRARAFDFECYMIALEWNRKEQDRFYLPRRECLRNLEDINGQKVDLVADYQDLLDGKLDILTVSLPQRVGKSRLSLFFLSMYCFKNLKNSIVGIGHSAGLVGTFYEEILMYFTTPKDYRVFEIFKGHLVGKNNAEKGTINIDKQLGIPSFTFRSIDGNITGQTDASLLNYVDDLIKDQSEIINKRIADNIWSKFNNLVLGRAKQDIPLLFVGTLWGDNCPLTRLIVEYKNDNNPKHRFRQFAWCNSKLESQFDYQYKVGFNTRHFKKLERTMKRADLALWNAMYMGKPIPREGRPFNILQYYIDLPEEKPDFVCAFVDVAVAEGGDKYSMPIGNVYEGTKSIYIHDVIYSNRGTDYTIPRTVDKIKQHNIEKVEFEEKEGAVGKKVNFGIASKVDELLRKDNYRCDIGNHSGSGLKSKLSRILSTANEILGIETDFGYKIYYLDEELRVGNMEYNDFIDCVRNFSEVIVKQEDDAPDSLSGLISYCVDGKKKGKVVVLDKRKWLPY